MTIPRGDGVPLFRRTPIVRRLRDDGDLDAIEMAMYLISFLRILVARAREPGAAGLAHSSCWF